MATKRRKKRVRRRSKKQTSFNILLGVALTFGAVVLIFFGYVFDSFFGNGNGGFLTRLHRTADVDKPSIEEMFLTPNEYSRPEKPLKRINGVVVHYTANPGSSAEDNRNYFEGLKDTKITKASSHFIIGIDGKIIQCIPLDEISYASNDRNKDTISIECCHPDETGAFTKETYDSLVKLTAWLCGKYNLRKDEIIRHYDVTGKDCPRYYVKHEDKWEEFKIKVFMYIRDNGK